MFRRIRLCKTATRITAAIDITAVNIRFKERECPRDKCCATGPPLPRKVLGELIVIKIEKGTSVALITRTTAEV